MTCTLSSYLFPSFYWHIVGVQYVKLVVLFCILLDWHPLCRRESCFLSWKRWAEAHHPANTWTHWAAQTQSSPNPWAAAVGSTVRLLSMQHPISLSWQPCEKGKGLTPAPLDSWQHWDRFTQLEKVKGSIPTLGIDGPTKGMYTSSHCSHLMRANLQREPSLGTLSSEI